MLLLIVAMALALSACGNHGASAVQAPASRGTAAPSATPADPVVCDSVGTLFLRLRSSSVQWVPAENPFDKVTASAVGNLSAALVGQSRQATTLTVRTALDTTATALDGLNAAMRRAHDRHDVLVAVDRVRHAYKTLKNACSLDGDTPADAENRTGTGAGASAPHRPLAAKPEGAECRRVQSIMVRMGEASARWSPSQHPFDRRAAAAFGKLSRELDDLTSSSTKGELRSAIRENAAAWEAIGEAMTSRRRTAINSSLAQAQTAYGHIKSVCTLPPVNSSR